MKLLKTTFLLATIATSSITSQAEAGAAVIVTTCAALSASTLTHDVLDGTLSITFATGDTISWTNLVGGGGLLTSLNLGGFLPAASPGSYTTVGADFAFSLGVDGVPGDSIDVSCSLAGSGSDAGSTTGSIGGESQTSATGSGVTDNANARLGDGGNTVSRGGVFVSTQSAAGLVRPDWNAWLTAEADVYTGGFTGTSYNVVVGIDRFIADDFLLGVLLGYNDISLTEGGSAASAKSPEFGAYFAARRDGLQYDGFITTARPVTTTAGTSFTSQRNAIGFTLSGMILRGNNELRPFLKAHGFEDRQAAYVGSGGAVAANTIQSATVSVGMQVLFGTPIGNTDLRPHISGAIDYRSRTSTLNGTDMFVYPRLGFGLSGETNDGGTLSLNVDGGKTRSDTFDFGVSFDYLLKF